jgi:hypothetical protein
MMNVELGAALWMPVLVALTGVMLAASRVRRGFFVGLSGGVLSVVLAYVVGGLFLIVPSEFPPLYTAVGAVGYCLAAIVYRPTVSPYLRCAALAVPMFAAAVLVRI